MAVSCTHHCCPLPSPTVNKLIGQRGGLRMYCVRRVGGIVTWWREGKRRTVIGNGEKLTAKVVQHKWESDNMDLNSNQAPLHFTHPLR